MRKQYLNENQRHINTTICGTNHAGEWLSQASKDDLIRVSRLLRLGCRNSHDYQDYTWSIEQVQKITGYTITNHGDYAMFEDALRTGLIELAKDSPELNVCPTYRRPPAPAGPS